MSTEHERHFNTLLNLWHTAPPENRDAFVADLRAMPYEKFLGTWYWRTVKGYVIHTRGAECAECRRKTRLDVHHTSYAHHGQEHLHLGDLVVRCRPCHVMMHEPGLLFCKDCIVRDGLSPIADYIPNHYCDSCDSKTDVALVKIWPLT